MTQVRYGPNPGYIPRRTICSLHLPAAAGAASATDPIANYDITVSPVRFKVRPVVLSSDPGVASSNYPSAAVVTRSCRGAGHAERQQRTDPVRGTRHVALDASLDRLLHELPVTLQTWEVIGTSRAAGFRLVVGGSLVRDRASGRPGVQLCGVCNPQWLQRALLPGGATTHSYDSGCLWSGTQ